ncbi:hypothetical protein [Roseinatronobacter sp. S2]|uniref:hypothetical protein n=1 Tax=Roseinatronobacter sp. S2 TaxID=3035471 RepID=UPI00240FE5A3|nr:hypothetical protein [Roseinatronobacter sp. S2]WFE76757.1 hypothetical protein P8S53_17045 [Roseinatronobacter sp. S2]
MTTTPAHEIDAFERNFSQFPSSVLGQIVLAASDLCVLVSADNTVDDIMRGGALEGAVGSGWAGKQLKSIVCHEAWHKLDLLWSRHDDAEPVWRHLNFMEGNEGADMPLLVRRIDGGDGRSILVCRDLRPVVQMQQKFSRALLEMEQSFEDTRWKQDLISSDLNKPKGRSVANKGRANLAVEQAITDVGHLPLSEILAQTGRVLEDLCIRQACEQCDYDLSKAAELLGMSSDELAGRFTFESKRA